MPELVTGQAWADLLTRYHRSAWRYECQGEYHEPYEVEPLRRFLAGEPYDLSYMKPWLQGIRDATAAGKTIGRVRVLTNPLTDYLRFEMAVAEINAAAGEDIRVIDADQAAALGLGDRDFWIFDNDTVAIMHFGPAGFEGATVERNLDAVEHYRRIRDRALQYAVPFREHPALLRSP